MNTEKMQQILLSPITLTEFKDVIAQTVNAEFGKWQTSLVPPTPTEFLTRKETTALLGISLVTLGEWTKQGIVQSYRIGTRVRYKRAEIETALSKTINLKTKVG
jgi:excisionase family DNA binding protein